MGKRFWVMGLGVRGNGLHRVSGQGVGVKNFGFMIKNNHISLLRFRVLGFRA